MQAANNLTLFHQCYFSTEKSKWTILATQWAHMLGSLRTSVINYQQGRKNVIIFWVANWTLVTYKILLLLDSTYAIAE